MKKLLTIFLVIALLLLVGCGKDSGANPTVSINTQDKIIVSVLNVGQGDAILIRTNFKNTLVDTGDSKEREQLMNELRKRGITRINSLILTHPHTDHIGNADYLIRQIKIDKVYDNGYPTGSPAVKRYLTEIKNRKVDYGILKENDRVDLGNGAVLKILSPGSEFLDKKNGGDINNNSIVGRVEFKNFKMLLTGDAEMVQEQTIIAKYLENDLSSFAMKIGHHGSKNGSSEKFMKAVSPKFSIISVGNGNDYGHPTPSALKRIQGVNSKIYRTDFNGTISVVSDGITHEVVSERE